MTIDSRAKGARWQLAVRHHLTGLGWGVQARPGGEAGDDLTVTTAGGRLLSVECKNGARMDLAGWMDQAHRQRRAWGSLPVLVVKRVRRPPQDAYVIVRLRDLPDLIGEGNHE